MTSDVGTDLGNDQLEFHSGVSDPSPSDVSATESDSPLMNLCRQFIAKKNSNETISGAFINRIAKEADCDSRVRRICHSFVSKLKLAFESTDELRQRVLTVLFTSEPGKPSKLDSLYDPSGIYALIHEIARYTSLELRRDEFQSYDHDPLDTIKEDGNEILDPSLVTGTDEEELRDRQLDSVVASRRLTEAVIKLLAIEPSDPVRGQEQTKLHNTGESMLPEKSIGVMQLDAMITLVPKSEETKREHQELTLQILAERASQKAKRTGQPANLGPDHKELRHICDTLGMQRNNFAACLGIGVPALSSYIYGKTQGVPEEVMKKARELLANGESVEEHWMTEASMSVIARKWAKELNVEFEKGSTAGVHDMAALLGVQPMTIDRWLKDQTKPNMTSLLRYDRQVRLYVSRQESMFKQNTQQSVRANQ